LDSKNEGDREIVAGAPLLKDSLNDESRRLFDDLLNGLTQLKLEYIVNDKLVRGLDYYSHTAFEFTSRSLGAQSAVLAGGRYDGLISQMGGPEIPGIGWAAGVERLSLLLGNTQFLDRPISVIPVNKDLTNEAINLADRLRRKGFNVELGYSGNLSKRMKRANKANSCAVIILGADEFLRNKSLVRDMDSGEQVEVSLEHLNKHLEPYK
jgi:histidyl-tRNA synthetase